MADTFTSALSGAIAGGIVAFVTERLKEWLKRPRAAVTASMVLSGGRGQPLHYSFEITIVNTGSQNIHVVNYGILRPAKLRPEHKEKMRELRRMHVQVEGCKGRFRRVKLFENAIAHFTGPVLLTPDQPHTQKVEWIDDWIGVELGGDGVAFAEDSRGRRYKARFKSPDFGSVMLSRTPEEHEAVQNRLPIWLRVDRSGKRVQENRSGVVTSSTEFSVQ